MFTRAFWTATLERAISTAAQSAILVFAADQVNALQADWELAGGFALGGFALSILKALAASQIGGAGPSLANEVAVPRSLGDGRHEA